MKRRKIIAGLGITIPYTVWAKPEIIDVVLPDHAQTSPGVIVDPDEGIVVDPDEGIVIDPNEDIIVDDICPTGYTFMCIHPKKGESYNKCVRDDMVQRFLDRGATLGSCDLIGEPYV